MKNLKESSFHEWSDTALQDLKIEWSKESSTRSFRDYIHYKICWQDADWRPIVLQPIKAHLSSSCPGNWRVQWGTCPWNKASHTWNSSSTGPAYVSGGSVTLRKMSCQQKWGLNIVFIKRPWVMMNSPVFLPVVPWRSDGLCVCWLESINYDIEWIIHISPTSEKREIQFVCSYLPFRALIPPNQSTNVGTQQCWHQTFRSSSAKAFT